MFRAGRQVSNTAGTSLYTGGSVLRASACVILSLSLTACATIGAAARSSNNNIKIGNQTKSTRAGAIGLPADNPADISVRYPILLAHGFETVGGISSDAAGGVWGFVQGGSQGAGVNEALFHWNVSGALIDEVDLTPLGPMAETGADSPVVTDATGDAWVGLRRSLIEVSDGGIGQVIALPDVSLPTAGSSLPLPPSAPGGPPAVQFTNVESLAIGPSGEIVVGRRFSTDLQLVDPGTRVVTTLALPSGTTLAGLGQDLSATSSYITAALYAGNGQYELGTYTSGAWALLGGAGSCPAYHISTKGAQLLAAGSGCVEARQMSANTASTLLYRQTLGSSEAARAYALGGKRFILQTNAGQYVEAATSAVPISLGTIVVSAYSSPAGSKKFRMRTEPVMLGDQTASSVDGSIWFVPAQGGRHIGRLTIRH